MISEITSWSYDMRDGTPVHRNVEINKMVLDKFSQYSASVMLCFMETANASW
jgi:hypothetical protein